MDEKVCYVQSFIAKSEIETSCAVLKLFYGRNFISEFVWIMLGVLNVDDCCVIS